MEHNLNRHNDSSISNEARSDSKGKSAETSSHPTRKSSLRFASSEVQTTFETSTQSEQNPVKKRGRFQLEKKPEQEKDLVQKEDKFEPISSHLNIATLEENWRQLAKDYRATKAMPDTEQETEIARIQQELCYAAGDHNRLFDTLANENDQKLLTQLFRDHCMPIRLPWQPLDRPESSN